MTPCVSGWIEAGAICSGLFLYVVCSICLNDEVKDDQKINNQTYIRQKLNLSPLEQSYICTSEYHK